MLLMACLLLKRGLLCQGQRAQQAGLIAQRWWDDVALDVLKHNRSLNVPVEERLHFASDEREEVWLIHHAAAQDDALRGEDAHEVDTGQRQVARLQLPGRVIERQAFGGNSPARLHGRPTCQPFQAIAVIGADAREGVRRLIARQADMAHFGMQQAVHHSPVDDAASADARSYSQIDEGIEALSRAPAPFAQRGAVDIGIKTNGYIQRATDGANHVSVRPTRLGSCGDRAVVGRASMQRDGAERPDTDGSELIGPEEGENLRERLAGRRRGKACLGPHICRAGADRADNLGAA